MVLVRTEPLISKSVCELESENFLYSCSKNCVSASAFSALNHILWPKY